jgi:hypothetical protein
MAFQWLFNGAPIGGANSTSYTLSNPQLTDAGTYSCWITNASPVATNPVCTVTVQASEPKGVTILRPIAMTVTPALQPGQIYSKAAIGSTNQAPQVDFVAHVSDAGLLSSTLFSNAVNADVFPGTFVTSSAAVSGAWTTTNAVPKRPAYFLATVTLVDGTNSFLASATDETPATMVSTHATTLYYMGNPSTLTVQTNGSGKTGKITSLVTPDTKIWGQPTNTATLEIGHQYTIQAAGAPTTNAFVRWDLTDSNGLSTNFPSNPMTFTMSSNLVISARYNNGH